MIWSSAQAQVSDGEQRTPLEPPGVERTVKEPKHRDLRLVAREAQSTRLEGTPIQDILGCHADIRGFGGIVSKLHQDLDVTGG